MFKLEYIEGSYHILKVKILKERGQDLVGPVPYQN